MDKDVKDAAADKNEQSSGGGVVAAAQKNTKKEETVTISKEAFNELMNRLSTVETEYKLMAAVQDKSKLNKIEDLRRSGKLVKEVKLRVVDGKIVVGWKTLMDEVYFADGKLIENQKVQIFFDDQSTKDLTMRMWASMPVYEPFEVIKESRDENGDFYYTVRRSDGKELEINILYVN